MIACWAAVGFGCSTLLEDVFDELLEDVLALLLLPADICLSLSPSPQKVSAKVMSPNDKIDFI
jgi:hypothetical protein